MATEQRNLDLLWMFGSGRMSFDEGFCKGYVRGFGGYYLPLPTSDNCHAFRDWPHTSACIEQHGANACVSPRIAH